MKNLLTGILLLILLFPAQAQRENVIYDEAKVPQYTLPPLLVSESGGTISTAKEWEETRRPELLQIFARQMFGQTPEGDIKASYKTLKTNPQSLGGKATCKQVRVTFSNGTIERNMLMLIYLPNRVKGKAPLFLGYNFQGNQTISDDTEIILPLFGYKDTNDITGNSWQAMGAWAWGLSRAMDYLETDKDVDASKVVLMGHSRNGKAALWAGAQDKRFAIVISNDSGCGGAALSKRTFGETIDIITSAFPHWFCKDFRRYAGNEQALPFDQHQFLALIAPRPLYVASAEEDLWADPKGEFLSACHAGEVYALYGMKGISAKAMPGINQPIMERVGYHIRSGVHDVTDFDWRNYIIFANKWLK